VCVCLDTACTQIIVVIVVLVELALTWGGTKYDWDGTCMRARCWVRITRTDTDPIIIIMLVVGVFLIVPFLFVQREAPAPILPLTMVRRVSWCVCTMMHCVRAR
jgi:hypothetical protein